MYFDALGTGGQVAMIWFDFRLNLAAGGAGFSLGIHNMGGTNAGAR